MNSTQVRYHRRRLADVAQAMRLARTQIRREQQPRARLAQHQQRRLETVVRHAAAHSPFYRRWLTETVALLTSGSSGRPGLFVCDAGGWRSIAAGFLRTANWCHLRPTVPA